MVANELILSQSGLIIDLRFNFCSVFVYTTHITKVKHIFTKIIESIKINDKKKLENRSEIKGQKLSTHTFIVYLPYHDDRW